MMNLIWKIDIVLLSLIILMPGMGLLSNFLFLVFLLGVFLRSLEKNNSFFILLIILLGSLNVFIISNNQYSFYDASFYSSLKIIFVIFLFFILNCYSKYNYNKIDFSNLYWFVSLVYYLSLTNIGLYIFFDYLLFSNEKGIAVQSIVLLSMLKSLIKKKIIFFDFFLIFIICIYVGSFRSIIFLFLFFPFFFKNRKKALYSFIILGLLMFLSYEIFLDKFNAFSYGIHGGNVVGRYAAMAMAYKVYDDGDLFGYGLGQYHNMYKYFFPYTPVEDIDYSGFSLAEYFFELGILVLFIYPCIFFLIKRYFKFSNYLIFIILFLSCMTSTTDKTFYISLPIILWSYNFFNEKKAALN